MSNNAISYKGLIEQLRQFAAGHFIIKQFSFGEITDFDLAQDSEYPIMHVLHPSVSVEQGVINYDLTIIFSDLPRDFEDKTTYQMEQISDLFRLGQDLLNVIVNEQNFQLFGEDAEINGTPTMNADVQETKNNLVQVTLEFTLSLPNDWSACDVPADWVIGQSGGSNMMPPTCCDVEYYISKNYQPGNTFDVGDVIRVSGSNQFALAQANTEANAAAVGVVTVAGPSFNYKMGGIVTEGVPNVAAGTVLYLSDTVAGGLTATPPAIRRPIMTMVESGQRAILHIHWMSAGGGGGAVDSVNGQTGVVVLDAGDVGADPAGSAATAESNANSYTDTAIAALTFVESVSDLSPSAIDNTDPLNPVTNIIPRSGTDSGFPILGGLEFDESVASNNIFLNEAGGATSVIDLVDIRLTRTAATGERSRLALNGVSVNLFAEDTSANGGSFEIKVNIGPDSATYPIAFYWGDATAHRIQIEGAAAPTVNDDNTLGYNLNSFWIYNGQMWICSDATTGAAVWNALGGGSGSPAGSDTQVQFNDGGSFGADAGFTYDKTDNILSINEASQIAVNGSAIDSHIRVAGDDGLTQVEVEAHRHTTVANAGASILWARSRGTELSPTIVQDGDRIASMTGVGFDGTDYATAAQIDFEVDGTPGSNDMPGRIIFKTSPDGSQTLTERMRINAAGNVIVANDLDATNVTVDDEAYGPSWDTSVEVPTKNAVYDKIETLPQQDSFTQSGNFGYVTVGAGVTTYGPYYGSQANFNTTQATRRIAGAVAGTISNCRITTGGAQPGTGSLVFTLQKNGADTSIVITVAAGSAAGTFVDSVNTVSVVDGDDLCWKVVNNASGASAIITGFCSLFTR
jgi:hypothetical protein